MGNSQEGNTNLKSNLQCHIILTSALRLLALRGCEHYVFAEGALQPPHQFRNV